MTKWIRSNSAKVYVDRAKECVLWGKSTKDMTRSELMVFIGVLDEIIATMTIKRSEFLEDSEL